MGRRCSTSNPVVVIHVSVDRRERLQPSQGAGASSPPTKFGRKKGARTSLPDFPKQPLATRPLLPSHSPPSSLRRRPRRSGPISATRASWSRAPPRRGSSSAHRPPPPFGWTVAERGSTRSRFALYRRWRTLTCLDRSWISGLACCSSLF
jgi:hypothetical protein